VWSCYHLAGESPVRRALPHRSERIRRRPIAGRYPPRVAGVGVAGVAIEQWSRSHAGSAVPVVTRGRKCTKRSEKVGNRLDDTGEPARTKARLRRHTSALQRRSCIAELDDEGAVSCRKERTFIDYPGTLRPGSKGKHGKKQSISTPMGEGLAYDIGAMRGCSKSPMEEIACGFHAGGPG